MSPKLILFGAGNIGRSFIGQLFSRGGYEVVFVDIVEAVVEAMNRERKYRVVVKHPDKGDETLWVLNARAVNGADRERVAAEIEDASVLATSVGKGALPHILPAIAQGLDRRLRASRGPIDIVIAENVRNAADLFRTELTRLCESGADAVRLAGLVETSIGKMVPIMRAEDMALDPLWVFAEPYNTLILDKKAFLNPIPQVPGLAPKDNMAAWVDRKLFVHNLGHAAAAYLAFRKNPSWTYLWEALADKELHARVRACMMQSAAALNREYPQDLPLNDLETHVDDLIYRFRNKALGDTIFRVGRDLFRKLDKEDRLIGSLLLAHRHGCPSDLIARAVVDACYFRATDEKGEMFGPDREFAEKVFPRGMGHVLKSVCRLAEENPLEAGAMREVMGMAGV